MRAIERKALAAFNECRPFKESNTEVVVTKESVCVYLFGNMIVWKDRTTGEVSYSHCGWHTPTTASRLRAFGANAYIRKGTLIIEK